MVTRQIQLIPLIVGLLASVGWGADFLPVNPPDFSNVPGTVIDFSPASSASYIGSPSIVVLGDGTYVVSHDFFGSGSDRQTTRVFASKDQGVTWTPMSSIKGQYCSSLFVHKDELYIMGLSRELGHVVIRKSDDGGTTWTTPEDSSSGVLRADGQFACAPTPVIEHGGRIWRAMEDTRGPGSGSHAFRCFMMSAEADADLLDADSWTSSNPIASDSNWLGGSFSGWMDGNAVVTQDDRIVDVLHVSGGPDDETSAVVQISDDGKTASFNSRTGFVAFPGGSKKFTIRFDPESKAYWTLSNYMLPEFSSLAPAMTRNTLALANSDDLQKWAVQSVVLSDADVERRSFQFADWAVEGEDLIAVSRATFDDPTGVPRGANFTNLLLFDRVRGFRDRKMSDAKLAAGPATAPSPPPVFESDDIRVTGKNFQSATLAVDGKVFANYEYKFTDITPQLAGWQFTRFAGHQNKAKLAAAQKADVYVKAKRQTVIYGATGMEVGDDVDLSGWIKVPDESISYLTSGNQSYSMTIFQRTLSTGELLHLPDGSWSGFWLLIPPAGGGLK